MKLTSFAISLVIVGAVVGVFMVLMSSLSENYSANYNKSSFSAYQKIGELNNLTKEVQENTLNASTKSGALDILGDFFSDAFSSVKILFKSYDIFKTMSDDAFDKLPLGGSGWVLKTSILLILLIAIIGVIIYAVVKVEI